MIKATKVRFISAPDVPSCLTFATLTIACSQPEMVRAARMRFKPRDVAERPRSFDKLRKDLAKVVPEAAETRTTLAPRRSD